MRTPYRRLVKSGSAVLAAVLCASAAAACGGSTGNQSQGHGGKKTLVVWQFWSGFAVGLQPLQKKLDAEFEAKYPQYVVNDVPISFTQMGTKLTAAIAAGTGPNIVSVFPGVAGAAYRNGLIPLQSYITASDRKNWRLLSEAAGPGGSIYSIPWSDYGYFIYYNKKLFTKAGLNPNVTPTTWQQFGPRDQRAVRRRDDHRPHLHGIRAEDDGAAAAAASAEDRRVAGRGELGRPWTTPTARNPRLLGSPRSAGVPEGPWRAKRTWLEPTRSALPPSRSNRLSGLARRSGAPVDGNAGAGGSRRCRMWPRC